MSEDVSPERFRGIRIFDISDLSRPVQVGAVQTCRGSHTHTLVKDPDDPANLYVYNSGTSAPRPGEELAGCSDLDPGEDPDTSLFSIDVIQVPLAAPETANNAATGAAMIPLLALGLPGGALTAMMVAVFQMHDLQPGPLVFWRPAARHVHVDRRRARLHARHRPGAPRRGAPRAVGAPLRVRRSGARGDHERASGYPDPGSVESAVPLPAALRALEVRGLVAEDQLKITAEFYTDEGAIRDGKFFAKGSREGVPIEDVPPPGAPEQGPRHMQHFIDCVRSRKREDVHAEILEGHRSALLVHLGRYVLPPSKRVRQEGGPRRA